MSDFVDGLLAGLVMGASGAGLLFGEAIRKWRERAKQQAAIAQRAEWSLAVERSAIKRERERARTELAR